MNTIDKPRLADLDPEAFAAALVDALAAFANELHAELGLPAIERLVPARAPLYQFALDLARYAQEGTPALDVDAATAQLRALLERALLAPDPDRPMRLEDPSDLPATPAGWAWLVLLAARGRAALEAGRPVPAGELAALASSGADYVRQLIRDGVLAGVRLDRDRAPTGVTHESALRWAVTRGVRELSFSGV
jgi:hypothetical protein